ncbi:hypothetical protein CRG98_041715 [Punica granatum]|uniref:Uncharacterized protein n=1 Tax=Punica granatum TaxID=22663 RepID=A0A2I0I243_PUNGR|nr:hypothetical protein CRG98_041715 [Punica granatum]
MRGQNPKEGPKPDAANAGPEPDAGPKPDTVNAGSKPDVGPEPNAVNACSIRNARGASDRRHGKDRFQLALINKLLVLLYDFSTKTISFGSKMSELGLDGHIRNGSCAGLKIPLIKGRMLGEVWTLGNHNSLRIQDLFDVTLAIYGCLILSPSMFKSSSRRILGDRL